MNNHNRTYTALLIALALLDSMGIITMLFLTNSPSSPPESRWILQMVAAINAVLVLAIVATLILRSALPKAGRIATTALNIVLLFSFPLGTALGIYGLMKVDRAVP